MADEKMLESAELSLEGLVPACIQLVRKGAFIEIYQKNGYLLALENYARQGNYASHAILSETYDQVGEYERASEWATREIGQEALRKLRAQPGNDRATVRALIMLILQSAVSLFRQGDKQALNLLDETISFLDANKERPEVKSQHVRSLFHFWRGRINSANYDFEAAESDFERALLVADQNLEQKLSAAAGNEAEHAKQVVAGNYIFSTCLSFGLGQLRQFEGKNNESLQYLRIALPLSRSTVDYHRRGFAHLLMGVAIRSQSKSHDRSRLGEADAHLKEAKRLFADPIHHLNLARVNHQLALSLYHQAQSDEKDASTRLEEASQLNKEAMQHSDDPSCANFRDAILDYGIQVVSSLIETSRGNYDAAEGAANNAIQIFEGRKLPPGTHGWALVAKGQAYAERVKEKHEDGYIAAAEVSLARAFADELVRHTDRAAAHLHLSRMYFRIGQTSRAQLHCDNADSLLKGTEHGWVVELAAKTKSDLDRNPGFQCLFDVRKLLNDAIKQGDEPWSFISDFVTERVRDQLLELKEEELQTDKGIIEVAEELKISRSTLYGWLRKKEQQKPRATKRGRRATRS